jgi:CXXX repeat peptide maturase
MLKYLIILLDDTSTSFCHYNIPTNRSKRLIDIEDLKKGIRFAMMENLMIQFVYPEEELPYYYLEAIDSIDHIDIKPHNERKMIDSDVLVFNKRPVNLFKESYPTTIFRMSLFEFFDFPVYLAKEAFQYIKRLDIVIKDLDPILAWDLNGYQKKIEELAKLVEQEYSNGNKPQWNILTDRMMLSEMNNCGAGDTVITLAPNGKFYICPAFYYDDMDDSVGDINIGLQIKNQHLYKIEFAPICYHCDAYQCKRCIWLNRRMTLEVNTPSHEQCVAAHIERNASRQIANNLKKRNKFYYDVEEIKEIDYLDPFNNREKWNQENL